MLAHASAASSTLLVDDLNLPMFPSKVN